MKENSLMILLLVLAVAGTFVLGLYLMSLYHSLTDEDRDEKQQENIDDDHNNHLFI